MPSDRFQLNVRLSPDAEARFRRLAVRVPAAVGTDVSHAGIVEMALKSLEEKYPPAGVAEPVPPPNPRGRKSRKSPPA